MCESFFATLETELLDRETFRNRTEARLAVFDYIEVFYNPRRRHSSIGNLSPAEYERSTVRHEERFDRPDSSPGPPVNAAQRGCCGRVLNSIPSVRLLTDNRSIYDAHRALEEVMR